MTPTTPPHGARARLLTTLASVLTALAVVVGAVGLAAPAQAATSHVTLSGHSTAWSDQKTTLTTTWKVGSKAHKGKVTLQRRSGKTWKKVSAKTTTSKGVAAFSVKPASTTTYRVLTSTKKASKAKKLTVKRAYTLTSTAGSTIMAGTGKTFAVSYKHHGKGVTSAVVLERRSGSHWVKVQNVKTSKGRGSVTVKPTATTTYRFRKPGKVTSASHTVTVKAPSTFSVSGSGSGHGVGLSQYGAYEMSLTGSSADSILLHYYASTAKLTAISAIAKPLDVRVQVWGGDPYPKSYADGAYSDTASTTTISFSGTWTVDFTSVGTTISGTAKDTLKVAVIGTGTSAKLSLTELVGGSLATKTTSQAVSIASFAVSWDSGEATVAGAQGTYHNGSLAVSAFKGRPNVVNVVPLNEYVYGISEMPSSWGSGKGVSALEAQAIGARTYAVGKVDKTIAPLPDPGCGCDLVDDTRDQNYAGWKKQNEGANGASGKTWVAAVNATGTKIVTYDGSAIDATFFAASGGRTANNADVWQGKTAGPQFDYLRSQTDPARSAPGNPYASWTRSITQKQALKVFSYASVPLKDVKAVSVSQKYSSGQVKELKGTSASGRTAYVSASPEWWRTTLGLPAAWVTSFTPKK